MSRNTVSKRLIVSCDGTWQSADTGPVENFTNAIKFCRALTQNRGEGEKEQIIYYQAGVGSGAMSKAQRLVAGGLGLGLEENSREAYSFLAYNYAPGDEIFLVGFSRGAYTARSIAGLIGALGMLSRDGMQFFKPVYDLYKNAKTTPDFEATLNHFISENGLKEGEWRVSPQVVEIKTVACWETVGALGVPENFVSKMLNLNEKWKFLDTQLPPRVEHAFQALGLDEHRSSFSPTLWWLHPSARYTRTSDKSIIDPELVQTWFPGHHSDIGGGNRDHKISNITLLWMIDNFTSRGLLDFDIEYVKSITSSTRNTADPSWVNNADPFYASFVPSILWTILGSKTRTPGQYAVPTGVATGSKTNELMHFSIRAKMEETAQTTGVRNVMKPPSKALKGYCYDASESAWVSTRTGREMSEVVLPSVKDEESLMAWMFSEWLPKQERRSS